MCQLEDAIALISFYYKNLIGHDGQPYIMHLLRVMLDVPKELDYQITALLHDFTSKFDYSYANIEKDYGNKVADAVKVLNETNPDESYRSYIKRITNNNIARIVKIADLKDEIRMLNKTNATETEISQQKIYENALHILEGERK